MNGNAYTICKAMGGGNGFSVARFYSIRIFKIGKTNGKRDGTMQIGNTREKIIQNLKDCDCDEAVIANFMEKFDAGQKKEALAILQKHRKDLLDLFHRCDGCIGCLDYLTNQITNEKV